MSNARVKSHHKLTMGKVTPQADYGCGQLKDNKELLGKEEGRFVIKKHLSGTVSLRDKLWSVFL